MAKQVRDEPVQGHVISLPQGAIKGLALILASPAWIKDDPEALGLSYRAGEIVEDVLPDLKMPVFKNEDEMKAWENKAGPTFTLNEKQREACKKAITFVIKGGSIPNGKPKNALLKQFGLIPDGE